MATVNVWESVLAAVEKRIPDQISRTNFTTWFLPIKYLSHDEAKIQLLVTDLVFRDWITSNFRVVLDESLKEANLADRELVFQVETLSREAQQTDGVRGAGQSNSVFGTQSVSASTTTFSNAAQTIVSTATAKAIENETYEVNLNPKYTFDTFVEGSENKHARAAAWLVANMLPEARDLNPLYIYGGAGLGKTHLMHAIAHKAKELDQQTRFYYVSFENFMNEMIEDIKRNRTMSFRDKYRSMDILLIDDIQYMAGKEGTKDELFHTFNALYEKRKRIIISSDCLPDEISTLEARLVSRFKGGCTINIQPPDWETRVAILCRKAEMEGFDLPGDVAHFIARKIKSNIRELEGALNSLMFRASVDRKPVNLSLAQEALRNLIDERDDSITIETIQRVVAKYYNLKVEELKKKSNAQKVVVPRQVAMYLCRTLTKASLEEIGSEFVPPKDPPKNHATVLHSIEKITKLYAQKDDFHKDINILIARCKET